MSTGLAETTAGRSIDSAQPYPWPHHGNLVGKHAALVACVDVRWRAPEASSDAADARLLALASAVRALGGLIVAVTATPSRVCAAAGDAVPVAPIELGADVQIEAGATNAFYGSVLDDVLRGQGRRDLFLSGWGLEGPVHSTMRAANDRGYECLLVYDACTAVEPELAFAAREMVRFSGGIFGAFADTAGVLASIAAAPDTRSRT